MVYAVLLGFRVENIRDLVERMRTNSPLKTRVVVEDTNFMKFLREVSKALETAIQRYSAVSGKAVDVVVREIKLEDFVDAVVDFVNGIAAKLPNYDERSFFVWSLDQNTFRYLKAVYPEIDSERGRELMRIFGMEKYFEPDVDNEELRREYSFYRFGRGSVGLALVRLFLLIFEKLNYTRLYVLFPEIPDFSREFRKMAYEALERSGWNKNRIFLWGNSHWSDCIMKLRENLNYSLYECIRELEHYYIIEGLLVKYHVDNTKNKRYVIDLPLIDVLNYLSPLLLLFSNLYCSLIFENNELIILGKLYALW